MRAGIVAIGLALTAGHAGSDVRQDGDTWVLENEVLSARLDASTGVLTVIDRGTGVEFRQPDSARDPLACEPGQELVVRRAAGPVQVDGSADEWQGVPLHVMDGSFLSAEEAWTLSGPATEEEPDHPRVPLERGHIEFGGHHTNSQWRDHQSHGETESCHHPHSPDSAVGTTRGTCGLGGHHT